MAIQARTRVPSAAANGKNGHTLISDAKFRQLYALALKLTLLAHGGNGHGEAARALAGREAVLAGIAADLSRDDQVLVRESALLADALGPAWPVSHTQPSSGRFSERMVEAVSGAAADRIRQNRRVTVIICDERIDEKVFTEARRLANSAKLPVLFVEDGRSAPAGPAPRRNNQQQFEEIAIPVDARDVVAIFRVAHESIARAREGTGPTRIQCVSWQPAAGSRKAPNAGNPDAVEHLEAWLEARGLPTQQWRREISAEFGNGRHKAAEQGLPSTSSGAEKAPDSSREDGFSSGTIHA